MFFQTAASTPASAKILLQKKNHANLSAAVTFADHRQIRWRFASVVRAAAALAVAFVALPPMLHARGNARFEALPLVRSRQNHLMVRALINGTPAWLTIDSGAPVSAIALQRQKYFRLGPVSADSNLPTRVQINGTFNNVAIARELRLGGLTLVDEPVVIVDFGEPARAARRAHEREIDGVIGADILFPTQAVLDCQRQLLILRTNPGLSGEMPGFDLRGLQAVPIQVSDDFNLYVKGSINGRPATLMVDTGSFTTLLHRSFVRKMRIATRRTPFSSAAVNLRERDVRVARIRKLRVGSVDLINKEVGVVDLDGLIHDGSLEGSPVAGLLGAETLRRHHGIIDFGTRTLYLRRW